MKNKLLLFIALFASSANMIAQCGGFFDGFETGSYTPNWSLVTANYVFTATTTNPYAGSYRIEGVGGGHFNGLVTTLPNQTPDSISWAICPQGSGVATNYFVAGDTNVVTNLGIVFCFRSPADSICFYVNSNTQFQYSISPNTWYHIEMKNINWVAHTYDIYINGLLQMTAYPFRTNSSSLSKIHLYNHSNATGIWDNIQVGSNAVAFAGPDMSSCNGNNITMTPIGTGTWSGGAGTWNGNVYTPSVSEATLGATINAVWTVNNGGCTGTDIAVISITPTMPAPTITASTTTPCANAQVTLTANPAAGYTNAQYWWYKNGTLVNYQNGGPGTYVINAGNVTSTNVYRLQVLYTGYSCNSLLSNPITIITNTPSATITAAGPTTFCANTPTTLNATPGMSNYVWKRSNITVQSGPSASYIPTLSGNHSVTVTNANGCTKTSTWTPITVKPLPLVNAGIDKSVCDGNSALIGLVGNVSNTYTWSPQNNLSNAFIATPTVTPSSTLVYTLTVNNVSTGCSNTDAVQITLLNLPPTPTLTSTPLGGNQTQLSSNTPNAISVKWFMDGVSFYASPAPNSSINVYASNPQKAYTVKSKGANGCFSLASNSISVRIGHEKGGDVVIGMDEEGLQAYPNPTTAILNVIVMNKDKESGDLLLYNSLGQIVLREPLFLVEGKGNLALDLSSLAAGVYSLVFEEYVQKVVKE